LFIFFQLIISFKYKFIFIKTYKTAGSSIESYLSQFLNNNDIVGPSEEYKGMNCIGDFETKGLDIYFPKKNIEKKINLKLKYFNHMPIWLIKERLGSLSNKLNYDIFNNFFKFGVIRNPFDTLVSDYCWRNSINYKDYPKSITFNKILDQLKSNIYPTYGPLNLNKLMDKNFDKILCDKIIKYENLNEELSIVFQKLGIPFSGKLEIFKKKSKRKRGYRNFYDDKSKKLIEEIFWKDMEMFGYKF